MLHGRRRAGRLVASVAQVLTPASGAAVSLLVVAVAGVETWGAFLGASILVRLVAQGLDFGSRDILLREMAATPSTATAIWWGHLRARLWLLPVAPAVLLAAGWDASAVLVLTGWCWVLALTRLSDALVVRAGAFRWAAASELGATGLTCAAVVLVGTGLDARGLVGIAAAVSGVRVALLLARLRPGWATPGPSPGGSVVEHLRRSWPFFLITFGGAIQGRIDLYLVAILLPAGELGAYGVLTNLVGLTQALAGAVAQSMAMALHRLPRRRALVAARRSAWLGLPVTVAAIVATALITSVLYGLDLGPPILAAAWAAMLPPFVYTPLVLLAYREGAERSVLLGALIGTVVAGAGTLVLAPRVGIAGAMVAAAAAQWVIAGWHIQRTLRAPAAATAAARAEA